MNIINDNERNLSCVTLELLKTKQLSFPNYMQKREREREKNRTDKNFIAQPEFNLQSFKSTPDSLKQRFKAFGRKPSLGAPVPNSRGAM